MSGPAGARHTEAPYVSAARRLLQGRTQATVLSAMGPQQPDALLAAVVRQARENGVQLTVLAADLTGRYDFVDEAAMGSFATGGLTLVTLAGGVPKRLAKLADHVPHTLWDIDRMIRDRLLPFDVVVARMADADLRGHVAHGDMVGYTPSALATDALAAFEVVPGRAWPGTSPVPLERAEVVVRPGPTARRAAESSRASTDPSPEQDTVGRLVAQLVPDGATLQLGLGMVPDAVVTHLHGRRDLGLHSGTLATTLRPLLGIEITGACKVEDRGVHVATGVLDPLGDSGWGPAVELRPLSETHAPPRLAAQPRLWAVNSAFEVDVLGQPNAEYTGGLRIASGGGQADFVHAAHASDGGAAVIALPSRTGHGRSRIVALLSGPHVATSPASDVDLVVTEHGVADLRGRTAREVAEALIAVAHPLDRPALRAAVTGG